MKPIFVPSRQRPIGSGGAYLRLYSGRRHVARGEAVRPRSRPVAGCAHSSCAWLTMGSEAGGVNSASRGGRCVGSGWPHYRLPLPAHPETPALATSRLLRTAGPAIAFWYPGTGWVQPGRELRVVRALGQRLQHVGDVDRVVARPAEEEQLERDVCAGRACCRRGSASTCSICASSSRSSVSISFVAVARRLLEDWSSDQSWRSATCGRSSRRGRTACRRRSRPGVLDPAGATPRTSDQLRVQRAQVAAKSFTDHLLSGTSRSSSSALSERQNPRSARARRGWSR